MASSSMTRDPFLWPFAATNPWNLPIAKAAQFEDPAAARSASLLRSDIGLWINQWQYSIPVYRAYFSDPLATVTDWNYSARSGTDRIPGAAEIAQGTDANLAVAQPGTTKVTDLWSVTRNSPTNYSVGRRQVVDLKTGGFGPNGGTRAAGACTLGGLIRDWEIDPAHPNYGGGVIRHVLAVALDVRQLYYAGGAAGYDSQGYGTSKGYVWPATEQDFNASSVYGGRVPMGTYFAIPGTVDLTTLGLSPQGLMLARGFQDYGAYVVDGTHGSLSVYVQANASSDWRAAILATNDLPKLRGLFRVVTNNTQSTPNGGATYDPRRAALAEFI
jgi:hypothetical protein